MAQVVRLRVAVSRKELPSVIFRRTTVICAICTAAHLTVVSLSTLISQARSQAIQAHWELDTTQANASYLQTWKYEAENPWCLPFLRKRPGLSGGNAQGSLLAFFF